MINNYSEQQIQLISTYLDDNIHYLDRGIKWVEENLKYEEKNNLLLKIKRTKGIYKKIKDNINDKPVMAVFGASQVGKSYLIQNLLSSNGKPFVIENKGVAYDFLKDINPPGVGAESTGVVTRFTIDENQLFEDHPIRIKLLSVKDVLTLVLDSYFLDLKRIQHPFNADAIEEKLKVLEKEYQGSVQSHLTEFDVLEIKEYFDTHLDKHVLLFETLKTTRLFERVARIIDGYSSDQWLNIFSFLWNKNEYLNELFYKLIDALNTLEFDHSANIKFEEVLRGKGEILDVRKLNNLFISNETTNVRKDNGDIIVIGSSVLSSIIKELIFNIPEELSDLKPFLKNSDLLDFPGARTRLGKEYSEITKDIIPNMFLRGKVSYLFNKYSDEFNINNLLFCANDIQVEVNELASLLFNWISRNIGETAEERTEALENTTTPPLFIIYTFFNNQIKFDTTNDINYSDFRSLDYKWKTRFDYIFKDEIVTQSRDWDRNWIKSDPNFKNMYVLRDLKYSTDTFNGYEETGVETSIREERIAYLHKLKESFLSYHFIKDHFKSPEKLWDGATSENENGSKAIIENLNKVSSNFTKINYYLSKINRLSDELKEEFIKFAHMDDIEKQRTQKMQKVNDFQFDFNVLLAKDQNAFNEFVNLFLVNPVDVYNKLNETIITPVPKNEKLDATDIFIQTYPVLQSAKTYDEVIVILKNELYRSSWTTQEVEDYLDSKGIDRKKLFKNKKPVTKSEYYVNLLLNEWKDRITTEENFQYFVANGISFSGISFISEHLIDLINRRKIDQHLMSLSNDIISETEDKRGIEEFLAEAFTLPINDLIINFDHNYFSEKTKEEFLELTNSKSFYYYGKLDQEPDNNLEPLFDSTVVANSISIMLDKYKQWIELLKISLFVSSGFATYDTKANEELLTIINELKPLNALI